MAQPPEEGAPLHGVHGVCLCQMHEMGCSGPCRRVRMGMWEMSVVIGLLPCCVSEWTFPG